MLRGIRKASENWFGRIVMGAIMTLLAGVFGLWGINDIFNGYGTSSLAKIGSTEIPVQLFSQTYNNRLQQLGVQVGHPIAPEQANALGLDRQVLGQLIAEAGLDQLAHQMRLGIPTSAIVQHVLSDPHFQTPTGQFDRAAFENFLQNIGYSEQRFFDEERRTIPRREITDAVSAGIAVPQVYRDAVNEFQNQVRGIRYVELGPQQAGDIPKPTDAELQKYFDQRKILFRAPEYRKVVVVTVTPPQLAPTIKVSDADVKKNYDDNINQYTTPERRHVEQIVFPTMKEAQAASTHVKAGLSFAALASQRGLKPSDIDLGTVPKSGIIDPAVATAAFALKVGEVSAPIKGRFGAVLVTVLGIEPGSVKPLSVVGPFIRSDIAQQRAKSKVQDIHDKIEDARAGGATLAEAAQKISVPTVTIDIDRSGRDPSGKVVTGDLTDAAQVINGAFSSDVGFDTYPIQTQDGYVWYEVEDITPARDRTLSEVKTEVEQRWRNGQIAKRLQTKAADLLAKVKSGNPFDALAAAGGLKVQVASGLKRGVAPPGISGKVVDAVFHTGKGAYGSSDGDAPAQQYVFQVTDVKTPPLDSASADGKKLDQLLGESLKDDVFSEYVAWLENYLGTTVNQSVLAQAIGGNNTPDSY